MSSSLRKYHAAVFDAAKRALRSRASVAIQARADAVAAYARKAGAL